MRAKEALRILGVSRVSLWTYVKKGIIKVTKLKNGYYEYDDNSIYAFIGKRDRKNIIYTRVSTSKQKDDLKRQIDYVSSYCESKHIHIDHIYGEVESGITLDRPQFQEMLNDIINGNVQKVFISYKDRLSRLSFMTLSAIFRKFNTEIIVISNALNKNGIKNDNLELYEDLLALMHYFTTKTYSLRKNKNLYKTT